MSYKCRSIEMDARRPSERCDTRHSDGTLNKIDRDKLISVLLLVVIISSHA